ncbi:MAG TPA: alpha/beta hydrolase [Anaerolineales bacterium]|nr:alpha/beta hydrolase [Anaerolineae bacterium]MBL1173338.1 alpha/beta hydrolase [Chloroflexota bacterium]MDL1927020.1 alpha/beta hydrolase [Anaerolineae bacterium AMX1]WKZ55973.1 MAG: alpha/beta hydrolase [Anaerolineales bacterium]NOG76844.1 alpha/beta hydrolase [Chloroflexota bacterium]
MTHPPIPFTDFNGSGPSLHFLHANGYPPACYLPLFEYLRPGLRVVGMHLRPLWPDADPDKLHDWLPLTDDFLRFLADRETGPVLAAGHSVGGIVALRAALKEPGRFRGLVLIDPVLFPPYFILLWNLLRLTGLDWKAHPKIPAALNRRRHFDDLETVYRGYRRRGVFRHLSDENLRAYIEGITRPRPGGGYELVYSPEWEARIYRTGIWRDLDLWRGLKTLQTPTLILRGAQSDTFWARTAARVRRANPKIQIETLERTTHLLPLEETEIAGRLIVEFANQIHL